MKNNTNFNFELTNIYNLKILITNITSKLWFLKTWGGDRPQPLSLESILGHNNMVQAIHFVKFIDERFKKKIDLIIRY